MRILFGSFFGLSLVFFKIVVHVFDQQVRILLVKSIHPQNLKNMAIQLAVRPIIVHHVHHVIESPGVRVFAPNCPYSMRRIKIELQIRIKRMELTAKF